MKDSNLMKTGVRAHVCVCITINEIYFNVMQAMFSIEKLYEVSLF